MVAGALRRCVYLPSREVTLSRRPGELRLAAANLGHKLCLIGFHVGINLLTDL